MDKRINTDLLYADLTYKIRGALFTVYNELGYGHKESVYQSALISELQSAKIPFEKEKSLDVFYKNDIVGNYRPDIVVDDKIIIELKAVEYMPNNYENQILHYLKTTGYSVGLLVNFGTPKLYIKRLVWTDQSKSATNPRKSL
jgi:GxxExxY protein